MSREVSSWFDLCLVTFGVYALNISPRQTMTTHRYGYTKGYTQLILGRKESCDLRRKPEKKTCGQWGPRRQTDQAGVAPHAPGTPPPDRSMTMNDNKIREAATKARDLIGNQSGDLTGAALDAWVILFEALRDADRTDADGA